MQIKYRVGVMPGPWPPGPDGAGFLWQLVDLCETTEIDSLWFSERLSSPLPVPEPMTTLAAVAARTRRLKFGPSVFITPFRNPVTAAREIAMIDYLSGGRMLPAFGIGVEQEREFHAAGVPFKERGRRTDEALAIMRRCWSADDATLEQCTAFGPPALLRERLEEYAAGGGSKFIARPMCPPERMLDQLRQLAEDVVPGFHRR